MGFSACAKQETMVPAAIASPSPDDGFFEIGVTPSPMPSFSPAPVPTAAPTAAPAYAVEQMDKRGYVYGHDVNLRGGPGLTYPIVDVVGYHTIVKVTGESGDWYRIKTDEVEGFILKSFVGIGGIPTPTPKPTKKPSTTPKTTKKPSSTSTPKPTIKQGEPGSYNDEEIYMVAQLAYAEGRGQGLDGYVAIANVLYNRVHSSRYGGSIEDVIFRPGQFTVADDREEFLAIKPNSTALSAAEQVFNGGLRVLPAGVMYFRSARNSKSWGKRTYYATIAGNNYYY